jgi:hypothetical protein
MLSAAAAPELMALKVFFGLQLTQQMMGLLGIWLQRTWMWMTLTLWPLP